MEIVEQTSALLHLRASEDYGWALAALALGYAAWGAGLARRRRAKGLAGYAAPLATLLFVPLALYGFVRRTDAVVDVAAGQLRVREVTAFGVPVRDEALPLAGAHPVLEREARRGGAFAWRVALESGPRVVPLRVDYSPDEAAERATLQRVASLLGVEAEVPF